MWQICKKNKNKIGIMIQEHGGYLLACDNCVRGNQASWSYEFNVCE